MKKLLMGLFVAANLISLNALADRQFVGSGKFYDMIQTYKANCTKTECNKPFRELSIFKDGVRSAFISRGDVNRLEKIAAKQAYIWMDTILAGDYHADGYTVLEEVIAIFKGSKIVAYKIDYSERAWYVGLCDWNPDDETSLMYCPEGKIHESSYVAPDLKTYIRNDDDIADFYN